MIPRPRCNIVLPLRPRIEVVAQDGEPVEFQQVDRVQCVYPHGHPGPCWHPKWEDREGRSPFNEEDDR